MCTSYLMVVKCIYERNEAPCLPFGALVQYWDVPDEDGVERVADVDVINGSQRLYVDEGTLEVD